MLKEDSNSLKNQDKQFKSPLFSTIEFEKFLREEGCFKPDTELMDIGGAAGATTLYFAEKNPKTKFLVVDYNTAYIKMGKETLTAHRLPNVKLEAGDWFNLPVSYKDCFAGIYSVHTLCCFKEVEKAIDALTKLNPEWIAFNSLFYEGPLDVLIHIRDKEHPEFKDDYPDADFNTFSLTFVKKYFAERGYKNFKYLKFQIPINLPKPPEGRRGTYTVKTEWDDRTQFSGPVHLPWYFVLAKKE